jgi:hypothetical protein
MFANELIHIEQRDKVNWNLAACRVAEGSLTSLFFSEQIDDIARAKQICTECALQVPCLEGARARREPWGVWGGQLFANGKILAQKRKRGRPPKIWPVEGGVEEVQAQSA